MTSNTPRPVSPAPDPPPPVRLKTIGFCGIDDSVSAHHVGAILQAYPFAEFGILFREDLEGRPRYASAAQVEKICDVVRAVREHSSSEISLAAHLCGKRADKLLAGDGAFVSELAAKGFTRVQVNATAANGADTSKLGEDIKKFIGVVGKHRQIEFIIQKNEETRPLWTALLLHRMTSEGGRKLRRLTMLVDESKGAGVAISKYPVPPEDYDVGYAGGIGPENIVGVLEKVAEAAAGRRTWIDMESSLRTETADGRNVFDLGKVFACIDAAVEGGYHSRPNFYGNKRKSPPTSDGAGGAADGEGKRQKK